MVAKVYLIGMPGSGKSTLGKRLAEEWNVPFVDLDKEIEAAEGRVIADIFKVEGEKYFRQVESSILQKWADSDTEFVMATGGGAPCFHQGIDIINKSGVSIFLRVPINVLLNRTQDQHDRPLLEDTDKRSRVLALWAVREPIYNQARIIIDNTDLQKSIAEVLAKMNDLV